MKNIQWMAVIALILGFTACGEQENPTEITQPVYMDIPYLQDFSIKYYFEEEIENPLKVASDRNGVIQVLASNKLYRPNNGRFQYPGSLSLDMNYLPMNDKMVSDLTLYEKQFVYLDDKAVLSNAWAGKLFLKHKSPSASIICGGNDMDFLISNGHDLIYLKDSSPGWKGNLEGEIVQSIKYDPLNDIFIILGENSVFSFSSYDKKLLKIYSGSSLTCFELIKDSQEIVLGTNNGFLKINQSGKIILELNEKLPWPELSAIKEINGNIWFGSSKGAFMLKEDGKFNYYFGERWLPGNVVADIQPGPENSVLILTDKGLGQICFKKMTLEDKAMVFEKQVRERHIRYGINANVTQLVNNDLSTNILKKADSDNLWTSMYMVSQLFRYLVTDSEEAKQNCFESFEAMERLHTINNIQGLFGRTFERQGYQEFRKEYRTYVEDYWYPGYNDQVSWYHADDEWDWRGTASSDQTVGQIFAMTLLAEYIDDPEWKKRAVKILDDLMSYIVENDFYLIDVNGLPTLWGRWNPEYVNRFGTMIGDRKICSSNIIAFLQTAYKHTGKEVFKEKAFELMNEHGYLENLVRPSSEIGIAPEDADNWSKMLSEEWNHSDDEMYFLAYWFLYPYAFNDTLKEQYKEAIRDHWDILRPEKNSLWNFCYALTGVNEFDLDESIWHLKEWPLDMIQYEVKNSHRKDIKLLETNFMGRITSEILPPDERPELKHNRSGFKLDNSDRKSELSAGDTYLLPYWMGRFLGVISAPEK